MDGSQVINPYLAGNFAPVRSEDDFELEVDGRDPRRPRAAPSTATAPTRSSSRATPTTGSPATA